MAAVAVTLRGGGKGYQGPHVYTSIAAPTVDNDGLHHHLVGDIIIDTTNHHAYILEDNTTAGAVWLLLA